MTALLLLFAILLLGIVAAGWIWILVVAFRFGDKKWGIACLLVPPLYFPYCLANYQTTFLPFWMVTTGLLIDGMIIGGVFVIAGSMN